MPERLSPITPGIFGATVERRRARTDIPHITVPTGTDVRASLPHFTEGGYIYLNPGHTAGVFSDLLRIHGGSAFARPYLYLVDFEEEPEREPLYYSSTDAHALAEFINKIPDTHIIPGQPIILKPLSGPSPAQLPPLSKIDLIRSLIHRMEMELGTNITNPNLDNHVLNAQAIVILINNLEPDFFSIVRTISYAHPNSNPFPPLKRYLEQLLPSPTDEEAKAIAKIA